MNGMLPQVLAIFVGGGLGSLLRYWISLRMSAASYCGFPIATLTANLLGAFLIGIAFAYVSQTSYISTNLKLFLMTGLCGGLTTFSTFSLEILTFIQKSQWILLTTTLLTNVVLSITVVSCSFYFIKRLLLRE